MKHRQHFVDRVASSAGGLRPSPSRQLNRLEWIASTSMLKTLPAEHGLTGDSHGP